MSDDRKLSRRDAMRLFVAGGGGLLLVHCGPIKPAPGEHSDYDWTKHSWGYVIDTTHCIGCCACMRACRAENDVPQGVFRTWIERYEIDAQDQVHVDAATSDDFSFKPTGVQTDKAFFVPKMCNHCEKSVCNQVCPVGAAYRTKDGAVLVDHGRCIGCAYCVQACPYGTRFINPKLHMADKCTWCYHRITKGLLPVCVQACPREARIFGDLADPKSRISTILKQKRYRVLKPEMGTHPRCFYLGLDREVV